MIEKVKNKMQQHVETILEKPIITNDEFMLLKMYLEKLEYIESQEKYKADSEERDKRFKALMGIVSGGVGDGM